MASGADISASLKAIFDAVLAETQTNPTFAQKLAQALGAALSQKAAASPEGGEELAAAALDDFDPLKINLEAALMNGLGDDVRAYLLSLSRPQLQEVVRVQRLPGASLVIQGIAEAADMAAAVELVIDAAVEQARARVSAAS